MQKWFQTHGTTLSLRKSGCFYRQPTTGGMELNMLSTLPPVFRPNIVPRS
jgi:hypothetical protein